jgi:hypothetical protein
MELDHHFGVQNNRDGKVTTHPFTDYFRGFEKVAAVNRIFGEKTKEVIRELRVEFIGASWGYMGVSNLDGHLIVSITYLMNGDFQDLY